MKFALVATLLSLLLSLVFIDAAPVLNKRSSGYATYYEVGLGYCGKTNSDNQMVVALSSDIMSKSKCGSSIHVKSAHGSVTVTVGK